MSANKNSEDNYVLPRNTRSSGRLTAQHYAFISRNGWLLHPTVKASLEGKTDVEISDVATGNGIFALELAEEMPTATITGLDISAAQYPPSWTTPSNIKFGLWNFFDPVPNEYVGRFDVVHIRLVVGAILKKDKTPVIQNLVKLLKPDGYLQWQEGTDHIFHRLSPDTMEAVPNSMSRLQRLVDNRVGIFSEGSWYSDHMLSALSDVSVGGLTDVIRFDPPVRRSIVKLETDLVFWSQFELLELLQEKGGVDSAFEKEFEDAWRETAAALEKGEAWTYIVPVFVGRKPA